MNIDELLNIGTKNDFSNQLVSGPLPGLTSTKYVTFG